jgi:hypothetical protein
MKDRLIPPGPFKIRRDDLNSRIARLPLWARRFIAQLETRADPSGDIREIADLRDRRDGLVKMIEQLKSSPAPANETAEPTPIHAPPEPNRATTSRHEPPAPKSLYDEFSNELLIRCVGSASKSALTQAARELKDKAKFRRLSFAEVDRAIAAVVSR